MPDLPIAVRKDLEDSICGTVATLVVENDIEKGTMNLQPALAIVKEA